MARNKVTERKKGSHTASNMLKALKLHRQGESIRKAAKTCGIAYPTLRRYVAQNLHVAETDLVNKRLLPNYDNHLVFNVDQEEVFKEYIKDCALKFYGLTAKDCRKVAYQMATINNINIPDSWKRDNMAGKEWFRSFRKRHRDLSIKKPEACSLARATSFNRETVKSFFDNLKTAMGRHPSFGNGCRLYNLDETSTTTVQRPQKVVAPKGRHNIAKVTSGEKGVLVTTCAIVCASGQALPPAFVFPRKNYKDVMLTGAPPGSLGLAHPSGWMTSDLFVEVIKHFIKHTAASPENPALLVLDNHESHLSIEALDIAKRSGVTILTLHPHTTAKMQPLDVGLNGPFKVYYNSAIDSWMMRHPGRSMTIYNVAECVGVAYARAMTPVNISAAFKKCGIFPFDPDVFSDIDYLPSDVTDRPQHEPQNPDVAPRLDPQHDDVQSLKSDDTFCEDEPMSPSLLDTENLAMGQSLDRSSTTTLKPSLIDTQNLTVDDFSNKHTITTLKPYFQILHNSPEARPSQNFSLISPKQFMPPLKASPRTGNRQPRKKGKSRIVTDTPEKQQIMEDKKKRLEKVKVTTIKRAVLLDKKQMRKKYVPKKAKENKKYKKINRDESSSEEELEGIPELSETELSEMGESEDDEEVPIIRGNFEKLIRRPVVNDYVLVIFNAKNIKIYYIAKVIEEEYGDNYGVSFMRLLNKENMKFRMPLEPDLASVNLKEIKMILPPPKINGTGSRNSTFSFPIHVAPVINLR